MLLKDLICEGVVTISGMYPEGEAKEMVFAYLEEILGTKRHTHILDPEIQVPDEKLEGILSDFTRMAAGEPLQYIIGKAWFYGRSFKVTPDVLIPRQETEILIDVCLKSLSSAKSFKSELEILDLCTGSGCIAWTLALELPQARVTAVDISDGALTLASLQDFSEEKGRTGASAPVFLKEDVLKESFSHEGLSMVQYDVILSNPPYVMDSERYLMRTNVLDHEPHLALFVPDEDPLKFYHALAHHASRLLAEDGFGIVEINEALGGETAAVFIREGFSTQILKDLCGKERFVKFSW